MCGGGDRRFCGPPPGALGPAAAVTATETVNLDCGGRQWRVAGGRSQRGGGEGGEINWCGDGTSGEILGRIFISSSTIHKDWYHSTETPNLGLRAFATIGTCHKHKHVFDPRGRILDSCMLVVCTHVLTSSAIHTWRGDYSTVCRFFVWL